MIKKTCSILLLSISFSALADDKALLKEAVENIGTLNQTVKDASSVENCLSTVETPGQPKGSLRIKGCDFNQELGIVKQPKAFAIEGQTGSSSTVNAVRTILTQIKKGEQAGNLSCSDLQAAIEKAFQNVTATNWDDYVMLNYIRSNLAQILEEPRNLLALGIAAEMNAGFIKGDHDFFKSSALKRDFEQKGDSLLENVALNFRNTFIELSMEEFKGRDVPAGYEGVAKMTVDARSEAANKIAEEFGKLLKTDMQSPTAKVITAKSFQYAKKCDGKLSQIFGNGDQTAASGSGWDRTASGKRDKLGDYTSDSRFHTCTSMHMYSDVNGPSSQMFYVPKGCSTSGTGTGKRCRTGKEFRDEVDGSCLEYSESFPSACGKLGRFGKVSIMASHLSKQGRTIPNTPNARGSTPVGFLGGAGGEDYGNGYTHSHIQLTGGKFRLSFSDAFCRSEY